MGLHGTSEQTREISVGQQSNFLGDVGRKKGGEQKTGWSDNINKMLKHKLFHRIAADWTANGLG